jgi:hypothetical protein
MPTNSCSCQQNPPVVIPPVSPFVCPDECCAEILASTCLIYDGPPIPAFGITTNQSLTQVIQNLAFGSGGEGGPSPLYQGPEYSTVDVENMPAGTYIYGMSYDQLFGNIYAPYVHPNFLSFIILNQIQNVLVGTNVSGTKTFLASYSTLPNVAPNTLQIINQNTQSILGSNLPLQNININIGDNVLYGPGTISWKGKATNTNNEIFESNLFTIRWMYNIYVGQSAGETLGQLDLNTLSVFNGLKENNQGTYTFVSSGQSISYKYFCFPDAYGSVNTFEDSVTGFAIALADATADPFYNQIDNFGNPYGILYVSLSEDVLDVPYRIYRTYYKLGGTYTITVN